MGSGGERFANDYPASYNEASTLLLPHLYLALYQRQSSSPRSPSPLLLRGRIFLQVHLQHNSSHPFPLIPNATNPPDMEGPFGTRGRSPSGLLTYEGLSPSYQERELGKGMRLCDTLDVSRVAVHRERATCASFARRAYR